MTMLTERGEEAALLVQNLSNASGSISFEAALDAFKPTSTSKTRALIILQLSQTKSDDLVDLFSSKISKLLSSMEAGNPDFLSLTRLLTSLYAVLPQAAHELTFETQAIRQLLTKSALEVDKSYLPAFVVSELLCAAANHAISRRWILSNYGKSMESAQKIVEIEEMSTSEYTPMHWLLSFAEKTNLENVSSGSLLCKVAMLSSLAMHKIQKGSKGKEADEQAEMYSKKQGGGEEDGDEGERRLQEDTLLYELAKAHIIEDERCDVDLFSDKVTLHSIDKSTKEELQRVCRLSSVESLTYLTLDSSFRDAVADAGQLLIELCILAKASHSSESNSSKTLFPQRGSNATNHTSAYELDKILSLQDNTRQEGQPDTALQYGLATLLCNIMASPPLMTEEEKQMEKLKRMANARAKVNVADQEEERVDARMTPAAIEERIEKVLNAGGAEALSVIALGGVKSHSIKSSLALRETVSKALLSMTTRQDKLQRGRIIQQGGARALLALSNQIIADALHGNDSEVQPFFTAMQGLSHLLITENPNFVLRDAAESIPCLLYLYFHTVSSRLQRFEAALALTNIASLGPDMSKGVVNCAFPRKVLGSTDFAGAGVNEAKEAKVRIVDVLDERIFLEDNEMSRRSALELLCNLLVDESMFKRWSGEEEDDNTEGAAGESFITQGKTMKNLIFLIALCSPLGVDQATGEGGLKLRMAASGAIAILCSSPSTCARLLVAETRILSKISRLMRLEADKDQQNDEEDIIEAKLHLQDISEDPLGSEHANLQLALRGLTCLDCLVQYVIWLQSLGNADVTMYKSKLVEAGCVEAIKQLALNMVKRVKQSSSIGVTKSLQEQVAQQSFDSLRACKSLHLV